MVDRPIMGTELKEQKFDLREQLAKVGLNKEEIEDVIKNASPGQFYAYRKACIYPWHLMFRYQDKNTGKSREVEVAIVDDYQFYEDNINRIWGRYLHEIFKGKEFTREFDLDEFFRGWSENKQMEFLESLSMDIPTYIHVGKSLRWCDLVFFKYKTGDYSENLTLYGYYRNASKARVKESEMRAHFNEYYENLKKKVEEKR